MRQRIDMNHLPDAVAAKKPSRLKRLLGALWYEERTVFVDTGQPGPRVLFTDGHEATHALCEWHEDLLRLDTEDELFKQLYRGVGSRGHLRRRPPHLPGRSLP